MLPGSQEQPPPHRGLREQLKGSRRRQVRRRRRVISELPISRPHRRVGGICRSWKDSSIQTG